MKQIISELWNSNLAPCEHCGAQDIKANTLYAKVQQGRGALEEMLLEEQRKPLAHYGQCWEDYLLRMMERAFQEGFVIGSRMAAEVYSTK